MGEGAGVVIANTAGDKIVDVITDTLGVERLAVDDKFPGGPGAGINYGDDPSLINLGRLENSGDPDMVVDGSTTPVVFSYDADPTSDKLLLLVRVAMSSQDIKFDGTSFGMSDVLTNGLKFEITYNDGTNFVIAEPKINEDMLLIGSTDVLNNTGPKDIWTINFRFSGARLVAGSSDCVKITVRDKLDQPGSNQFYFLQAEAFSALVVP